MQGGHNVADRERLDGVEVDDRSDGTDEDEYDNEVVKYEHYHDDSNWLSVSVVLCSGRPVKGVECFQTRLGAVRGIGSGPRTTIYFYFFPILFNVFIYREFSGTSNQSNNIMTYHRIFYL